MKEILDTNHLSDMHNDYISRNNDQEEKHKDLSFIILEEPLK